MVFYDDRHKFDFQVDNFKSYPCYREFYEAQFSCSDDLFEFMMELSFQKRQSGQFTVDALILGRLCQLGAPVTNHSL